MHMMCLSKNDDFCYFPLVPTPGDTVYVYSLLSGAPKMG